MFQPLKVMCVGDSITYGFNSTDAGGYRSELFTGLNARLGYLPMSAGFDIYGYLGRNKMCGLSGERTDETLVRTLVQMPTFKPDYIFLHTGTNDTTQLATSAGPNSVAQSMVYLTSILNSTFAANPECRLFICTIIDNGTYHSQVVTYNTALTTLVQARPEYAKGNLILVDMYTAMGLYSTSTWGDATHPNAAGYTVMANKFLSVIDGLNLI